MWDAVRPRAWLPARVHRRVAGGQTALAMVAFQLAVMFVGATLPTPLYPLYQLEFGFGGFMLTLIYAVYVLGNLIALLFFGRLSDQVGRRGVSLAAIGFGFASTLAFLLADATAWLFAARVLSGLATGLASGTATAWIAELQPQGDRAAAASIAAAANMGGTALGPLLAGMLAAFTPWPLRICYVVYSALLVVATIATLVPPETVASRVRQFDDLSLDPRLGVPRNIRITFAASAATAFATFSLLGFYSALLPGLIKDSLHEPSPAVAGAVVFELFLFAAAGAAVTSRWTSRTTMLTGLALLPPILTLLVAAQIAGSMVLLVATTALAGLAAAFGYRGSLEVVNQIAPDDQRAEVVSSYLIAVFLGNSLPVIGIGLSSDVLGSLAAHIGFAGLIGVIAMAALGIGSKYAPRT